MSALIQWASDNYEWVFSGIGVSALAALGLAMRKRSTGTTQVVKDSSNVTQVGGNFTVTKSDD